MKEITGKNIASKGKIADLSAALPLMDGDKPGTSNSKLPSKLQSRYPLLSKAYERKYGSEKVEVVKASNDSNDTPKNLANTKDGSVMVEELTVKNYKASSSMAVQHSSKGDTIPLRSDKEQWHHYVNITGGSSNAVVRASELNGANKRPTIPVRTLPPVLSSEVHNVLGNSSSHSYEEMRTQPQPSSGVLPHSSKIGLKDKGTVNTLHGSDHAKAKTVSFAQTSGRKAGRVDLGFLVHEFRARKRRLGEDGGHAHISDPSTLGVIGGLTDADSHGESLREWIEEGSYKTKKDERLFVFKQVLELVAQAQLEGTALKELRPSCFLMFPSMKVKYIGMWRTGDEINDFFKGEYCGERKRMFEHGFKSSEGVFPKHQKVKKSKMKKVSDPNFDASNDLEVREEIDLNCSYQDPTFDEHVLSLNQTQSKCESTHFEEKWYSSPEELKGECCTIQSNIFSLGVLLFELCCSFDSPELHGRAMSDLTHRILPPKFLSENTNEAGFILWLMHPIPSGRPKPSEIMESEMIKDIRYLPLTNELSTAIDEEESQSELLVHFLLALKDKKQKQALKLAKDLVYLNGDIEEVRKRDYLNVEQLDKNKAISDRSKELDALSSSLAPPPHVLMKNMSQLENAYFSLKLQNADESNKDVSNEENLGAFFEGVCKYARYSKFVTRGIVRGGDFMGSGNVICSLSFDRDEEYFAAAGVSKKIKIFEYDSLLNNMVDIHYPRLEMSNKAKLSSVCWNNYIKNYLASADYDGAIKLWDVNTGQTFSQWGGHLKRAWSVDFCRGDPTKLASGSDDCHVKVWSINNNKIASEIKTVANICCVQFSTRSTNLLAYGSADYKICCYDLRNTRAPWCTLAGHGKAVSYVKFLDKDTLVSASTDNSIKLWDLSKTASGDVCKVSTLTFKGHSNEKNFVGLSVFDGYIACGSESNEVVAYYRSLPMPITSYKFGSIDPISGQEEDEHGPFVSSVCWRGSSSMVVAANSNGVIKLLQLK